MAFYPNLIPSIIDYLDSREDDAAANLATECRAVPLDVWEAATGFVWACICNDNQALRRYDMLRDLIQAGADVQIREVRMRADRVRMQVESGRSCGGCGELHCNHPYNR